MKTTLFTAVLLFVSTVAFGQNPDPPQQRTGDVSLSIAPVTTPLPLPFNIAEQVSATHVEMSFYGWSIGTYVTHNPRQLEHLHIEVPPAYMYIARRVIKVNWFIDAEWRIQVGTSRFPIENANWINSHIVLSKNITPGVAIYLSHLSNAWTATSNPGIDHLGIRINF